MADLHITGRVGSVHHVYLISGWSDRVSTLLLQPIPHERDLWVIPASKYQFHFNEGTDSMTNETFADRRTFSASRAAFA